MSQPKPTASSPDDLAAQLGAVREVLRAISASPFDLDGVLGIVAERMTEFSATVVASSPEQFAKFQAQELARWREVIINGKITLD